MGLDEQYYQYTQIRNLAWELSIKNEISSLPVDVELIAESSGVKVMNYTDGMDLLKSCGLLETASKNKSISIYTDCWYILYDEKIEPEICRRFSIAHELGHILLKHDMEKTKVGYFTAFHSTYNTMEETNLGVELDAYKFATRLLAPASVLNKINCVEAKDIAEVCGLYPIYADERANRVKNLREKNNFFKHRLEKKAYDFFEKYMSDPKNYKPV